MRNTAPGLERKAHRFYPAGLLEIDNNEKEELLAQNTIARQTLNGLLSAVSYSYKAQNATILNQIINTVNKSADYFGSDVESARMASTNDLLRSVL